MEAKIGHVANLIGQFQGRVESYGEKSSIGLSPGLFSLHKLNSNLHEVKLS